MYALVNGNNFYVSCERVFRPSVNGRPVVVLSNDDGCVIARSNEAKDLGIKMDAPRFTIRHLEESAGLVALSANFVLYGDMSDRMMNLAAGHGPTQEISSIDASFVGLHGVNGDLVIRSRKVRERILQWTGISTCIGMAPTKTPAKLANHIAKTTEQAWQRPAPERHDDPASRTAASPQPSAGLSQLSSAVAVAIALRSRRALAAYDRASIRHR